MCAEEATPRYRDGSSAAGPRTLDVPPGSSDAGRDPARHLLAGHHQGVPVSRRIAGEYQRREGPMPSSGVVRWGILGPGSIATRFMRHAGEAANAEAVSYTHLTLPT